MESGITANFTASIHTRLLLKDMASHQFDFLLEAELRSEFEQVRQRLEFQAGTVIMEPEKYIKVIPLLLRGTIKVLRQSSDGNELFIYYIQAGESCAVSLSTSLMGKLSNIKAIVEEDIELYAIPASTANSWYEKYPSWRMFVLKTMNQRFDEIMNTLDGVAFKKVDQRLIDFLKARAQIIQSNYLTITHQEIANELSTSREVISRMLKLFEQRGFVKLFRNKVEIISLM